MHIFLPRLRLVISHVLHPSSNPDKTAPLARTVRKQWTILDCLSRILRQFQGVPQQYIPIATEAGLFATEEPTFGGPIIILLKAYGYTSFQNTYKVSPKVMVCDPLCLRVLLLCFCWLCWFPADIARLR